MNLGDGPLAAQQSIQQMRRHNYDEIASRLEILDAGLREAGCSKYDRVRIYIKNIRELAEARRNGRLGVIATELDCNRRRELIWSFVEGLELAEALESLKNRQCPLPFEVLERALSGPVDPSLENEHNNLGRNTAFELVFAGDLAAAGLKPQLGLEPDIITEFLGRRLLIACKRPLRAATVPQQVETAARQLGRQLKTEANPRDCGLIAVSVTRAFTTGEKLLEVTSHTQVSDYLDGELRKLAHQYEKAWLGIKSPKISGLIFQMSTPGYIVEDELLITAAQTLIIHIVGKTDLSLLEELAGSLQAKVAA